MDKDGAGSWGAKAIAAAQETQKLLPDAKLSWPEWLTRWIPILGQLWDCRREHLKEAIYEVACVLIFSTLPLWFFPLISSILFTVDMHFFAEAVSSGELLIYSATLSGTMVYFIARKYGEVEARRDGGASSPLALSVSFPYGRMFIVLSALICMTSAAISFMIKASRHLLSEHSTIIDYDGMAVFSWALFLVSVVTFYCAVAYRNLLDDTRSYRNEPAQDILASWDEQK